MRIAKRIPIQPVVALAAVLVLLSCAFFGSDRPAAERDRERFTFAVVSDTHTGGTKRTGGPVFRRIIEMLNEEKPDLLVHCGDWIIGPSYDRAGRATADTFFSCLALLDSSIAFYPVLGNHEGDHIDYTYSRSLFPLLERGGWYSFDHGNAHFFVVENNSDAPDSTLRGYSSCKPNGGINTPGSPQREWLAADLAGRGDRPAWTFGFGHRTYYGAEQYSGRKNIVSARREADSFCRLVEDANVDIFFSGDQHCYTRTTPIRDGRVWEETDSSTVYLTVGGGGGRINRGVTAGIEFPALEGFPDGAFVTGTRSAHFYLLCEVEGGTFHADVIDTSGALVDSFTIRKQS